MVPFVIGVSLLVLGWTNGWGGNAGRLIAKASGYGLAASLLVGFAFSEWVAWQMSLRWIWGTATAIAWLAVLAGFRHAASEGFFELSGRRR